MSFDKKEFIESFLEESTERLNSISSDIEKLIKSPEDKDLHNSILRNLHTIKGSARMLDFNNIEEIAHRFEDLFKSISIDNADISEHFIKLTNYLVEYLFKMMDKVKETDSDSMDIKKISDICQKAAQGYYINPDYLYEEITKNNEIELSSDEEEFSTSDSFDKITSVRIDIKRINEIIQSYDNLIIKQFRLKHQIESLEKKLKAGNLKQPFELPRQIKEDITITEDALFETQRHIFGLRMFPLEMVLSPLKKEIENDAIHLNKKIQIDIPPSSFMMDKMILEEVRTILLHIIRNSLVHGIEDEETRIRLGKNPVGLISIHTTQTSNKVILSIMDDGSGIQYDKVREKAMQIFTAKKTEIDQMQDKDLQQYIFSPGFSTSDSTSKFSGRGMGLDIVRNCMEKIKGKIKVHTKKNEGTTFELTIPLTLATQRGLFVFAGRMKVMIPSHYIQEIVAATEKSIHTLQGQNYISIRNKLIPLYYLSSILGTERTRNINSIIIVEYIETRLALVVDSIQQNENVIINPMPQILRKIEALRGVVYDENYAIIPILDIPCLIQKTRGLVAYDLKKYQVMNKSISKKILIVDDSETTRQIEETIFKSVGYIVETAYDGIDAIEKLKMTHFDAIVTDINMPRMDGNTLLANLSRMEQYDGIPIVVVTGAYKEDQKRQFLEAGAKAFFVKSDFKREALLQKVRELLNEK